MKNVHRLHKLKLNNATRKDHFSLPFISAILDKLARHSLFFFLDGVYPNSHFLRDQEKTTFTCPFGTYAYKLMPFGLYNAPGPVMYDGDLQ